MSDLEFQRELSPDQLREALSLLERAAGVKPQNLQVGDLSSADATRFKRMRESIEAMKEIWTKSEAEYHGEFVHFDPMIARPKPVQKPHPPIHVGCAFPHGARRAIRYGDCWIPTAGRGDIAAALPKFREMVREAVRDTASIVIR